MARTHHRLLAWQKGIELVGLVYRVTGSFPAEERFGLSSQMRRAAVSVPSNIAEGAGRGGKPELARFLRLARGSASELETQLLVAKHLGLVEANTPIDAHLDQVFSLINGLIRSVESRRHASRLTPHLSPGEHQ